MHIRVTRGSFDVGRRDDVVEGSAVMRLEPPETFELVVF